MNISIDLQLNGEIDNRVITDFAKLHEFSDGDLMKIGNLQIGGVPEEVEYEISKLIFNRVEIVEKRLENEKLTLKIASTKIDKG